MPDTSSTQNMKKRHNFFPSIFSGDFSSYLNEQKFEEFLNGMLDYFSENKNKNHFGLMLNGIVKQDHYDKLTNILKYLNEGLNNIKLPLDKINLARKLNSIIRNKSLEAYTDIDNEFYRLIFFSVNVTENTIRFSPPDRKKTPINETIFGYLSREVEDFGNVVLHLRNQYHEHKIIETTVAGLIKNTTNYLKKAEKQVEQVEYAFVSQFNRGINEIEAVCEELFSTRDCYYPNSAEDQYHGIIAGRFPLDTQNAPKVLEKLHNEISFSELPHSEDQIGNLLNYFSNYATDKNSQHSGISENFVDNLSLWIHTLPNNFQAIEPSPKPEIYNRLFYLVEKIIADPHFTSQKFFYVTNAIDTCFILMQELLKQGYDTTVGSFASLFNLISKKEQISIGYKSHYAAELAKLGLTCLQHEACNATLVLKKFIQVLGTMVSNISTSGIDTKKFEIEKIELTVQQLIKNATDKISESEIKEIAIGFIKTYSNETQITENCERLFNFINCSSSTSNPISLTTITGINLNNDSALNEFHDNTDLTNSTLSEIIESNNQFYLISKLGTGAFFGVLTGSLNGASQFLLHIAKQKKCSLPTQRFLAVTLALTESFAISTLPLLYSIVENLANEKTDSLVNSQKVLTCTYAFITSIVLQSINAGVQYALPKKSILKNLFNMLPLFASLWMLANGEERALESLAILATHILTSITASSLTYFSLNRFISAKNQQCDIESLYTNVKYDVQKNELEMNPLIGKKIEVTSEVAKKKYNFINQNTLDKIRSDLIEPIIALAHLCTVYRARIDTMETITTNLQKIDPNQSIEFKKVISKDSEDFTTLRKNLISLDIYRILLGTQDIMNFHPDSYLDKMESMLKDYMYRINLDKGTIQKEIKDYSSFDKNVILKDLDYTPERLEEISESVKIPGKADVLPSLDSLMEFAKEGYSKHNEACGIFENKEDFINNAGSLCALLRNLNCLITTTLDNLKAIGGLETSSNIEKKDLSANANKPYLRNKEMKYIIQILQPLSLNLATIIKKHEGLVGDDANILISQANGHLRNPSVSKDTRRNTFAFYSNSSGSDGETRFSVTSSSDESTKSDGYGNSALNNIEEQQQESLMSTRLRYS